MSVLQRGGEQLPNLPSVDRDIDDLVIFFRKLLVEGSKV
jgi:hypothetical protein